MEELVKAYRITSTEYIANEPMVFLLKDGRYYGDLCYPMRNKFPAEVYYWYYALCSDAGRHFKVEEVLLMKENVLWLEQVSDEINKYKSLIIENIIPLEIGQSKVYTLQRIQTMFIKTLPKTENHA